MKVIIMFLSLLSSYEVLSVDLVYEANLTMENCIREVDELYNVDGEEAIKICSKNSSISFVNCSKDLDLLQNVDGEEAASFCYEKNSIDYRYCSSILDRLYNVDGEEAASFCLLNSSEDFIRCATERSFAEYVDGEEAASSCLVESNPIYRACLNSGERLSYCLGRTNKYSIQFSINLNKLVEDSYINDSTFPILDDGDWNLQFINPKTKTVVISKKIGSDLIKIENYVLDFYLKTDLEMFELRLVERDFFTSNDIYLLGTLKVGELKQFSNGSGLKIKINKH